VRYFLEAYDSSPAVPSSYFPGRGVRIMLEYKDSKRVCIGTMGALHPKVLSNFSINYPVSVVEINVDPLVFWGEGWPQLAANACET
jgi:phenylalanyl-tRNA synthetase beta subunit